ncbi:hypothetical protein [Erythrobacter sp. QSSC1-22B]|uniref:hypothetical protein n=1 Tax=Erythrobacter sp. QSSC1-22B TaxID=1860125 RepID=UPI00143B5C6A|nr:hypothetical protein [Erythrobacter sp. QSSC1-22B]
MVIPNSEFDFLEPTETGRSEISCTTIIERKFPDNTVPRKNPCGTVARRLMKDLAHHVRDSKQLTEDERDAILDYILDFYGVGLW